MKKEFSTKWIGSKKPRKQRKYVRKAPLHIKQKFLAAHLSKELRAKHGIRSATVIKGDKVKILRGQFRGKDGKVDSVDQKKTKVFITGIDLVKKDGSKAMHPINPSNLVILDMVLDDKKRMKSENNGKTTS
ncbi:MAG: 50S ribosomal protein L24 [Candidatus Nanoarchaeia archaeon]